MSDSVRVSDCKSERKSTTVSNRRLINIKELAEMIGVSTKTVYRWRDQGRIPPGKQLSDQTIRWDIRTIEAWFERLPPAGNVRRPR